jgi:hypothetical protein
MQSDAKSIYIVNDGRRNYVNGVGSLIKLPRQRPNAHATARLFS